MQPFIKYCISTFVLKHLLLKPSKLFNTYYGGRLGLLVRVNNDRDTIYEL